MFRGYRRSRGRGRRVRFVFGFIFDSFVSIRGLVGELMMTVRGCYVSIYGFLFGAYFA